VCILLFCLLQKTPFYHSLAEFLRLAVNSLFFNRGTPQSFKSFRLYLSFGWPVTRFFLDFSSGLWVVFCSVSSPHKIKLSSNPPSFSLFLGPLTARTRLNSCPGPPELSFSQRPKFLHVTCRHHGPRNRPCGLLAGSDPPPLPSEMRMISSE